MPCLVHISLIILSNGYIIALDINGDIGDPTLNISFPFLFYLGSRISIVLVFLTHLLKVECHFELNIVVEWLSNTIKNFEVHF